MTVQNIVMRKGRVHRVVCRGGVLRGVGEVSGRCVGDGMLLKYGWEEGWRPATRSALLSGYLGKSGHLPRFSCSSKMVKSMYVYQRLSINEVWLSALRTIGKSTV